MPPIVIVRPADCIKFVGMLVLDDLSADTVLDLNSKRRGVNLELGCLPLVEGWYLLRAKTDWAELDPCSSCKTTRTPLSFIVVRCILL